MSRRKTVEELKQTGGWIHLSDAEKARRIAMETAPPFEFGMPPRPSGMTPRQRRIWDKYTTALYADRILARSDQSLLLKYIDASLLKDWAAAKEVFDIFEARTPFPEQVEEVQPEEVIKPVREIPNALESATAYCNDVLSGKIVAGKLVQLACKRFLNDLQETVEFKFSHVAAQHAVDFIHRLGLDLLGWELMCIAAIFGFLLPSGLRRFRTALICVARKNGKTGLAAGIALYMASPEGDGEKNANVYIAATSKYQSASLAFKKACEFREENPWLECKTKKWKAAITWPGTNSSLEPLASNSERLAGLNVHCAVEDEVGDMQDDGALCSVLESGTVGRRQSLILVISTSAANREQILYQKRGRAVSVLEGTLPGQELFAYIAELDENDLPDVEANWIKSNPSLGTLVPIENLRNEYAAAKVIVSSTRRFYRYNLNMWNSTTLTSWLDYRDLEAQGCAYIETEQKDWSPARRLAAAEARLQMGQFETVPGTKPGEAERRIPLPDRFCVMGLDLAIVDDLSCAVMLFPPEREGGIWQCIPRFFCPEENVERRWRENKIPYTSWRDNGYIISTPGTTTDPDFIRGEILNLRSRFRISELGFDRTFAESLCKQLEAEGMKVTQVNQGFNLSSSVQMCEREFKSHTLCTFGHPVMNFCLNNVSLRRGYQETVAISKERSKEKVDGASALATAMYIQQHQPVRNNDPNRFRVRVL